MRRLLVLLLTLFTPLTLSGRVLAGELRFEQLETSGSPAARFDQSMTTDFDSGRVYLFGGRDGDKYFNDLWVLERRKLSWHKIETGSGGPTPRSGGSLTYDPESGRLILFGGFRTTNLGGLEFYRQLWTFSEKDGWSREYFKAGPEGRAWHGAVLLGRKLLIFGGYSGKQHPYLNDIWELDTANWSFERAATDGGPKMDGRPGLLPLDNNFKILVFGRVGTFNATATRRWVLNGTADKWTTQRAANDPDPGYNILLADRRSKVLCAVEIARDEHKVKRIAWCGKQPDGKWHKQNLEQGPLSTEGLVCTPDPLKPAGWVCFGGAFRAEISDKTWLVEYSDGHGSVR